MRIKERIRCLLILTALLIAVILPSPLTLAAKETGFQTVVLQNGITVKYRVMKDQPQAVMGAIVPIGFHNENKKGMAHLLEHLVFRGGSGFDYQDIAGITSRRGGYFNGFTSFFTTGYYYVTPSENFADAFKIFNGSLWHTDLSEPTVALERKIVLHELDLDYPEHCQYYALYQYFYPEFYYSAESVTDIAAADLESFHRTYYQPKNITYILAGNFDPKSAFAKLEKLQNGYGPGEPPPATMQEFSLPAGEVVEEQKLYPYHFQVLLGYEWENLTPNERAALKFLTWLYEYDGKIDYLRNAYQIYSTVYRKVGVKDYFGIFYLEGNREFDGEYYEQIKARMLKYFQEFKKIDLRTELGNLQRYLELEKINQHTSPTAAMEYEMDKLSDPDRLTDEDYGLLRKLTGKSWVELIDKLFGVQPKTWILVKNTP